MRWLWRAQSLGLATDASNQKPGTTRLCARAPTLELIANVMSFSTYHAKPAALTPHGAPAFASSRVDEAIHWLVRFPAEKTAPETQRHAVPSPGMKLQAPIRSSPTRHHRTFRIHLRPSERSMTRLPVSFAHARRIQSVGEAPARAAQSRKHYGGIPLGYLPLASSTTHLNMLLSTTRVVTATLSFMSCPSRLEWPCL